jgi:hypothetical protein
MPSGISHYYVGSTFVTTGAESPIIVVDALPDGGVSFTPIEVVAFILAQPKYDAGTLIVQAFSGGSMVAFVGEANQATITYDPLASGWESKEVPAPATFSKFRSGTTLYQAMTSASQRALEVAVDQFEALLLSHRQALAALELHPSLAEVEGSGWCNCDENGVSYNKCKPGYKPRCIDLGDGKWDCECVQK